MSDKKKLIICKSNVGRSQEGEAIGSSLEKGFMSAGIEDLSEKYSDGLPSEVLDVLREWQINATDNRVKKVTQDMVDQADVILVLCSPDLLPEFVKQHSNVLVREIADPYGKDYEIHKKVRDKIETAILQLLIWLAYTDKRYAYCGEPPFQHYLLQSDGRFIPVYD